MEVVFAHVLPTQDTNETKKENKKTNVKIIILVRNGLINAQNLQKV